MPVTINGTSGLVTATSYAGSGGDLTGITTGKVLQYKVANKTDQSSITGTTPTQIPSFSVTITPTASNSTMIVRASCFYSMDTGNVTCSRIYNGTSFLISPSSFPSPANQNGSSNIYTTQQFMMQQEFMAYETAGNTNARTYSVYWNVTGGTGYINRWGGYSGYHSVSTLEVIEVAA